MKNIIQQIHYNMLVNGFEAKDGDMEMARVELNILRMKMVKRVLNIRTKVQLVLEK